MTVLSVAYPLHPVKSDSGGGAEQVLAMIERQLVRAGHRSIVVAARASQVAGELVETPACSGEITDEARHEAQRVHADSIRRALERYPVDLIHFHGLDFYAYVPEQAVPKLGTLHLPISLYPGSIFDDTRLHLNCVSRSQANSAPRASRLPIIFNGVELERYRTNSGERHFLLTIARICPEKGIHIALQAAHRLDLPLVIAGPVHPFRSHEAYFSERVQPLLDEKRRYLGAVDYDAKADLLGKARCLLVPSLIAETSSLVAMEAISSGTPVVALRTGALPEVVEDGVTGFIVDSEDQIADAVQRVGEISSETCRAIAEARFDARRMVGDYVELYRSVMGKRVEVVN